MINFVIEQPSALVIWNGKQMRRSHHLPILEFAGYSRNKICGSGALTWANVTSFVAVGLRVKVCCYTEEEWNRGVAE